MNYNDTIAPGDAIAVGDIHGRFDLFEGFLNRVRDTGARVILLGDMIDRGPNDLDVLRAARNFSQNPELLGIESLTALRGNHELMYMNAQQGFVFSDWVRNGGNTDIFGELQEFDPWLLELPYFVTIGDTLFSHAGVTPGVNPQENLKTAYLRESFLWNRGPFLTVGPQFEKWSDNLKKVVFGHTPKGPLPYTVPNGICIDTGAYITGTLTAYNATRNTFFQISDQE